MNRETVLALLKAAGVDYALYEHPAVYHMGELENAGVPQLDRIAKNLLLRDDKKSAYYLVSIADDKRLDLKAFRKAHGTRPLSFASDADLERLLGIPAGSVTPLALLNDRESQATLFLDEDFFAGSANIGVHPNDNTATIFLATAALVDFLRGHGVSVEVCAF